MTHSTANLRIAPQRGLASLAESAYAGLRVTILGMARQGVALARFFLSAGALVTVSDLRSGEQLATARAELERYAEESRRLSGAEYSDSGDARGVPRASRQWRQGHRNAEPHALREGESSWDAPVRFVFGSHPLALLDETDLLCLSGGVSPAIPIALAAAARGIPLSNDAQLTLRHCPVPIVAITGSAGKTTTTTLVGLMLEAADFTVHVGGNIGTPLIDRLDTIGPGDKVVMEFSSFQLELVDTSPSLSAILNITPNHLDRHPSMSHYAAAKARILQYQVQGNICVLNADDAFTGPWLRTGRCQIAEGAGQPPVYLPIQATRLGFSLRDEVPAGAFLRSPLGRSPLGQSPAPVAGAHPRPADMLLLRRLGMPDAEICRVRDVRLRGRHNLANMLAAACLADAAGADISAVTEVATSFGGVEHRLEIVRRLGDVLWVNDSIATTPERTAAALRSFAEPVVLLAGGRDKHLPWDECVATIHGTGEDDSVRVRHVVLFGEAAALIGDALTRYERENEVTPIPFTRCTSLEEAVAGAAKLAYPGDVVLLAPGGTSFDAYGDYAARGQHFRSLVEALS